MPGGLLLEGAELGPRKGELGTDVDTPGKGMGCEENDELGRGGGYADVRNKRQAGWRDKKQDAYPSSDFQ